MNLAKKYAEPWLHHEIVVTDDKGNEVKGIINQFKTVEKDGRQQYQFKVTTKDMSTLNFFGGGE